MLSNSVVGKDCWKSLDCKEIQPVNSKGNQSWIFVGRTDAETEALVLWSLDGKRPWYGERLKAGGEEDVRGWDDCMASLTQWTWVWACHQLKEMVKDKEAWHAAVYRMAKSWMWLSDWTTTYMLLYNFRNDFSQKPYSFFPQLLAHIFLINCK